MLLPGFKHIEIPSLTQLKLEYKMRQDGQYSGEKQVPAKRGQPDGSSLVYTDSQISMMEKSTAMAKKEGEE